MLKVVKKLILILQVLFLIQLNGCLFNGVEGQPETAGTLRLKGLEALSNGFFSEAHTFFLKSLQIAEQEKDEFSALLALKYIGTLYSSQGFNIPDTALYYYGLAEARLENLLLTFTEESQIPPEYLIEQNNILNNKALIYQAKGDYESSLFYLEKVVKSDRKRNDSLLLSKSLLNLGRAFRDYAVLENDDSKFRNYLQKALSLIDESIRLVPSGIGYINKARCFDLIGSIDSTLYYYRIAIRQFTEEKNILWSAVATANSGILLKKMASTNTDSVLRSNLNRSAIDSLSKALNVIEKLRSNVQDETLRSSFFDDKVFYYENLIELFYREKNYDALFETIEKAKARSLLDMLATKEIGQNKNYPPEIAILIAQEKELRRRMDFISEIPDSAETYAKLSGQYDEVLKVLNEKEPDYASLKSVQPVTLSEIRKCIDSKGAFLEYFIGKSFSVVLLIDSESVFAKPIFLQNYSVEDSVTSVLAQIISFHNYRSQFKANVKASEVKSGNRNPYPVMEQKWAEEVTNGNWQYRFFNLFNVLIGKEIKSKLEGKEYVYVIPHGILHHLPFNALITSPAHLDFSKNKHIIRPKFLIEEFEIMMLPSASVLPYLYKRKIDRSGNFTKALIIGDPIYPIPGWNPLPGSLAEAEAVSSHFTEPLLLTKDSATETRIKSVIGNYDIVHFGTHGIFEPSNALKSKLLFTKSSQDDGILTAEEVFNLEIKSNLVVLSACQSGQVGSFLGDRKSAGDDVVGLSRAFIYAGTASLFATLWIVDDKSTQRVIEELFKYIIEEKLPFHQALRLAQLSVLNDPDELDWKHPFFWAPYFMITSNEIK